MTFVLNFQSLKLFISLTETFIGITASLTESVDKVKAMRLDRRKCVIRGEPMTNLPEKQRLKAFRYSRFNIEFLMTSKTIQAQKGTF